MNYLEKRNPTTRRRVANENLPDGNRNGREDLMAGNHGAAKVLGGAMLALVAWGVLANFPQIRRYIRMELM